MINDEFFDEARVQSRIKSTIVEHYFITWSQIIMATQLRNRRSENRSGYIDLFSGPGIYNSGEKSTPLRILGKAIENDNLCQRLVTIFNDKNQNYSDSLQTAISSLDGIENLMHKPSVHNEEVSNSLVQLLRSMHEIPSLVFIDPWGYKGLSRELIDSAIDGWGSDCIFFFNYNRINQSISIDAVNPHMNAIFGDKTKSFCITISLQERHRLSHITSPYFYHGAFQGVRCDERDHG